MYKKLSLSVVAITIVIFIGNFSQVFSQTAQSPTKKELVQELVLIMNIKDSAVKEQEEVFVQLIQALQNQTLNNSKGNQEQKEELKKQLGTFTQTIKTFGDKLRQRIDIGKLSEDIALEVYDKHYTESEIKDFITFYKTPTGQKSLKTMRVVNQEMMVMANAKIMPIMGEIINEEMEKLKKSN